MEKIYFEKLKSASVKGLHRLYATFILYKFQQLIPKMSHINSAHATPYCLLKIFNNLPPTPRSSN